LSDFIGATTDVIKLGVSKKSAAGVLVDITVASMELNAIVCHFNTVSRVV
jgi:hypothetical protein